MQRLGEKPWVSSLIVTVVTVVIRVCSHGWTQRRPCAAWDDPETGGLCATFIVQSHKIYVGCLLVLNPIARFVLHGPELQVRDAVSVFVWQAFACLLVEVAIMLHDM